MGHSIQPPADMRGELRREAIFAGLAFLGMIGALVAPKFGAAPLIANCLFGISYFFGGWYGVRSAWESLLERRFEIDLLMVAAAGGALAIGRPFEGAMLLFLFSLSNTLQHFASGRARRAIEALMKLRPDEVRVRGEDGTEQVVPLEEVKVNQAFVLRPGDRIPLDGRVIEGEGSVDQSTLTGESKPVTKRVGDEVYAGTSNGTGALVVEVDRPAHESSLARMITLVEEAQAGRAETQQFMDRFEQPYVVGVFLLTLLALIVPLLLFGEAFDTAFYRAMTLMVATSPCALVISTPAAILSAVANGARRGVLFKGGAYVEEAGRVRALAFDKTGTLTAGKTVLAAIQPLDPDNGNELLRIAASVQVHSEHHLAKATVETATSKGLSLSPTSEFIATTGQGVRAVVDGEEILIGNLLFFSSREQDEAGLLGSALKQVAELEEKAFTAVLVTRAGTPLGVLGFADTLRPGTAEVIEELRYLGIEEIVMLTGDNYAVAEAIAEKAGITEYHAGLLPEEKIRKIRELRNEYEVVSMVGDGVNDAPALASSDLGVAMGAVGTDVALETADLVLMGDDLEGLAHAIALSRKARRILFANIAISLVAILVMVVGIFSVGLPLPLAVLGHEGSTVLVSLNGLRLLGFRR